MWVKCSERQPEQWGEYRVIRRAMGRRPSYEDVAKWTPPSNNNDGYWINTRCSIISTVEEWWEEEE